MSYVPLLLVCGLLPLFSLSDDADLISNLPGLSYSLNFKQYSGYLDALGTRKLHYWFVESQADPANDPVLLWLNGGPGCSSLDGLLSEHGPFVMDDQATLTRNPHAWNQRASVLYLEAPAGVGFSYDPQGGYNTTDDQVSANNHAALVQFFKRYPQFKANRFYVSGESYGGIYVPTLTLRIHENKAVTGINLQGFVVGNGLSSFPLNTNSLVYFMYYHGVFGDELMHSLVTHCCTTPGAFHTCNYYNNTDPTCIKGMSQMYHYFNDIGLNEYALYLPCSPSATDNMRKLRFDAFNLFKQYGFADRSEMLGDKLGDVPPCINSTAQTVYLNRLDVRRALHIPDFVPSWEICSDAVEQGYVTTYVTMFDVYQRLLDHYKALVYNGDTDMACNFLGDQWFVNSLRRQVVKERGPWYVEKQVAGFVKRFKNLDFVTVRGAGHMVPQWRPPQAYHMLMAFLDGRDY